MDVNSWVDLYDTDILRIEEVVLACDRFAGDRGWRVNLEDYRRQVVERFHDAGFVVDLLVYEQLLTNGERQYQFVLQIEGKIEPKEFDFDQQVHEATHDVLKLGEEGFIPSLQKADMDEKALAHNSKKGHSHDGQGWHCH